MPHRVNIWSRHLITVDECMFGDCNVKGKREYSSTTVSMYVFRDVVDSGPLKSILSRSIGCVDFISVPGVGRYNCGFSSTQILHVEQVFLTSSVENGMFFDLTKCNNRVTPG